MSPVADGVFATLMLLFLCNLASILLGLAYINFAEPVWVDVAANVETRNLLAAWLVMPFMETVFFQLLVIEGAAFLSEKYLSDRLKKRMILWAGCVSVLAFAAAHGYLNGQFNGLVYALPGGVAMAWAYLMNRRISREFAFASTWLLHAAINMLSDATLVYVSSIT